jgi:hypothetical protein
LAQVARLGLHRIKLVVRSASSCLRRELALHGIILSPQIGNLTISAA